MLRALLMAAAGLALYAGLATGAPQEMRSTVPTVADSPRPVLPLGFASGRLVRLDLRSLRPVRRSGIDVGSGGCAPRNGGSACWTNPPWTLAPNGRVLALAGARPRAGVNNVPAITVVNARTLRTQATIRVSGEPIGALAWLDPDWVLAVQEVAGERQQVTAYDLAARRPMVQTPLEGSVQKLALTPSELVMLVAPAQRIGPARLAVVGARGAVRFVELDRVLAGTRRLDGDFRFDSRMPGLAVDPESHRAFVVAKGLAAEIDLRTLAVAYHDLDRKGSFLSSVLGWLDPVASAKEFTGQIRVAHWLGHGLLVVSGADTAASTMTPAGLTVIDTESWQVQTLDPGATAFALSPDALVATGGRYDDDAKRELGIGLAVYGLDGELRFRLFGGTQVWAWVLGKHAFASGSGFQGLRVVDLATGRVVGQRGPELPSPLRGRGGGWWGDF